jgi:23S rRNA (uracil1939-C5)-methyltransferase
MHPWINQALMRLQGRCGETSQLSIRYGVNTGDYLIQPMLRSPDVALITGQPHYTEALKGRRFQIASPSFFQVNTHQAEQMVDLLKEGLSLSISELLVDTYAGVGTFAFLLAEHVQRVVAIEDSASAIEDARGNAGDTQNVRFVLGRTEMMLSILSETPDALILDPPRKGCHPQAIETLKQLKPRKVAYVSCEPATLGRDLKLLCDDTFDILSVQPVDMFPQTHHVECVAFLALRG